MRLREEELFTTTVDGQSVLLDATSSVYLQANAAGTAILDALADHQDHSLDDLVTVLTRRYGIDDAVARHDCEHFLEQLRNQQLLTD